MMDRLKLYEEINLPDSHLSCSLLGSGPFYSGLNVIGIQEKNLQ